MTMRLNTLFAGTAAAVALAAMLTAGPAEAAKRKRVVIEHRAIPQIVVRPSGTHYTFVGPDGIGRRYFVTERRSYLNPGTEVLPGEGNYTNYVFPPAYSPTANIDVFSPSGSFRRQPLSDPWDLPNFSKY
jgi:hypothetical protein